MAITSLENYFLFVIFSDFHLIIDIGKVKLDKMLNLAKLI